MNTNMRLATVNLTQLLKIDWSVLWIGAQRFLLMTAGSLVGALGYSLFQIPHNIAAGGISGLGIIINHFTGWPIGLLFWLMNIPMLILGFFYLGRWHFLWRTLYSATVFAAAVDIFRYWLPQVLDRYPLTDDLLLSALYGGIVGGIGLGLLFRAGSTIGGTGIIGRILQLRTGRPLSSVYIYTDGIIILLAALIFGWEIALYAFLLLFVHGLATDYVLEGPSNTRTATIITAKPHEVIALLQSRLNRGASYWAVTGGYTGQRRFLVMCTVNRSQVRELNQVVAATDQGAFVIIGVSHRALGGGFDPLRHQMGL